MRALAAPPAVGEGDQVVDRAVGVEQSTDPRDARGQFGGRIVLGVLALPCLLAIRLQAQHREIPRGGVHLGVQRDDRPDRHPGQAGGGDVPRHVR